MANTQHWGRYAELRPQQLDAIMAVCVAERVVQRTGGLLLPSTWWPITALPHRYSLSIGSDVVQALWDGIFAELARAGFKLVVLLSGHYAQGHELVLMDAAEHAITAHGLLVLAVPPLALVDEEMLDHAAHWETALLLALRPRLVALEMLNAAPLHPSTSAVLGEIGRASCRERV